MTDDEPEDLVLRVYFCPGCHDEVFAEPGAAIECGVCNTPFAETTETVIVAKDGAILTVN
jgi:hypothetical protein